jgi:regulator of sigma E protease
MPFVEALELSGPSIYAITYGSIKGFWSLLVGRISHKLLGGPIMMIQEGAKSANKGGAEMLEFMILVNVSLAVLNLLPIPVLDGGHIMIFTIEAIRGVALSARVYERVTIAGMLVLFSLMLLALSNDIMRVVGWL